VDGKKEKCRRTREGAISATKNIIPGRTDKSNIWDVNTEQDYHETKQKP
jgi:hypothetical protein